MRKDKNTKDEIAARGTVSARGGASRIGSGAGGGGRISIKTGLESACAPGEYTRKGASVEYPHGVQLDYPVSSMPASCTPCYDQPYSHGTQESHIETCKSAGDAESWIGMGAKSSSGSASFALFAYIRASDLVRSYSTSEACGPRNGVYWYFYHDRSVGFASTSSVNLNYADSNSADCSSRLS